MAFLRSPGHPSCNNLNYSHPPFVLFPRRFRGLLTPDFLPGPVWGSINNQVYPIKWPENFTHVQRATNTHRKSIQCEPYFKHKKYFPELMVREKQVFDPVRFCYESHNNQQAEQHQVMTSVVPWSLPHKNSWYYKPTTICNFLNLSLLWWLCLSRHP